MSGILMLMRRFGADERGNFAMISAGLMTLMIGCAGLAIDLGTIFADRRKTQSTADLAAIADAVPQGQHASLPGRHLLNLESADRFNATLTAFLAPRTPRS